MPRPQKSSWPGPPRPKIQSQLDRLVDFQARHGEVAPAALRRLKETTADGGTVFGALMEAVRHCSLGQISEAFFEVGGQYRRNV